MLCHLRSKREVAVQVEVFGKVLGQHPAQVLCDTVHASGMGKLHCRLSVWISADLCVGMNDAVELLKQVIDGNTVREFAGFYKVLLPMGNGIFSLRSFLQYNQVAAHFCPGVIGKKIVGQAYSGNHIAPLGQPFPYRAVLF